MADYQSYKKIAGDKAIVANTIGPNQVTGIATGIVCRMFYYNCCLNVPENGGCCYLWTVPNNVKSIQFEIISGAVKSQLLKKRSSKEEKLGDVVNQFIQTSGLSKKFPYQIFVV